MWVGAVRSARYWRGPRFQEGGGWTIPNATLSPDLEDFFIQFGSDDSPLDKSLAVRGKVTIQCP